MFGRGKGYEGLNRKQLEEYCTTLTKDIVNLKMDLRLAQVLNDTIRTDHSNQENKYLGIIEDLRTNALNHDKVCPYAKNQRLDALQKKINELVKQQEDIKNEV